MKIYTALKISVYLTVLFAIQNCRNSQKKKLLDGDREFSLDLKKILRIFLWFWTLIQTRDIDQTKLAQSIDSKNAEFESESAIRKSVIKVIFHSFNSKRCRNIWKLIISVSKCHILKLILSILIKCIYSEYKKAKK